VNNGAGTIFQVLQRAGFTKRGDRKMNVRNEAIMIFRMFLVLVISLLCAPLALAHHSDAGLDENKVVSLQGKVIDFSWKQPHAYLSIEVLEDGKPVQWDIQLVAINVLARQRGWTSKSLQPGDAVFVRVNPAEDGRRYGKLSAIERQDGSPVATAPGAASEAKPRAASMDGNWLSDRSRSGPVYPGGYDGFFRAQLVLTDAAKSAAMSYNPLSDENPEASCTGRPTPAALLSSTGYMLNFDLSEKRTAIKIRSEWFNELRTVYMDGRDFPDPSQTFATGYSIGHWDGDSLVIDSRNFDFHRSPYQIGVPSGTQKRVIETYRLIEDGAAMQAEFTLRDPEYLSQPLSHSRVLLYTPHLQMLASNCDVESSRRFLK
jgi:hypothetical protein